MPNTAEPIIFGAFAVALREAGLAVLPADGKKPVLSGFNTWRRAPGIATVKKWCEINPRANIVYVPALSCTSKNPNGLVVVDADNAAEVERVEELFGRTPAMIETRRGRHFIYRAGDVPLGKIGSLRRAGFDIDIKHGQSGSGISVAPPSRHPNQRDFAYGWHAESGLEALAELPTFDAGALQDLICSPSKTLRHAPYKSELLCNASEQSKTLRNVTNTAPPPRGTLGRARPELFRDGSRKLGLNDHLCAHAGFIEDFNTCLDLACSWNEDLHDRRGMEKLPFEEVEEVCRSVMHAIESGKLVRTLRLRATAWSDADEVRRLAAMSQNGAAAFTLLMLLRAEHGARCLRGETFALCIEAMVNAETLGDWSARRYREARDALLRVGLIECVSECQRPAQYRLTDRASTPSIAQRGEM